MSDRLDDLSPVDWQRHCESFGTRNTLQAWIQNFIKEGIFTKRAVSGSMEKKMYGVGVSNSRTLSEAPPLLENFGVSKPPETALSMCPFSYFL